MMRKIMKMTTAVALCAVVSVCGVCADCRAAAAADVLPAVRVCLNGLACVPDSSARVLYCPVRAEAGRPLTVSFSANVAGVGFVLDGSPVGRDGVTEVADWRGGHTLSVVCGGTDDTWGLVFTTLPVVELKTAAGLSAAYVRASIRISDPLARTGGRPEVACACLLRYRGASSMGYEKKSFAVKLIDAAGEDSDLDILGIRMENSWILDAAAVDVSRLRNRVLFDIWNEMARLPYGVRGRNGTRGGYVEVLLNGRYHGLYCLSDKVDRKLLDLKKSTGERTRGLLYKCTVWKAGIYLDHYEEASMDVASWNAWELKYPEDFPSEKTWRPLADLIDFCGDDARPDEDWLAELPEWFYEENLRQYMLFVMAFNLRDNALKNTYLSCRDAEAGHRFLFTPWDLDTGLGRDWDGTLFDSPVEWGLMSGPQPFCRLLSMQGSRFRDDVARDRAELQATTLSPQHVEEVFRAYADCLMASGAWGRERARWQGNPVVLPEDLGEEVDYMMEWYARNFRQMQRLLPLPAGIGALRATPLPEAVFGLDGRRLPAVPPRGFYIEGGKKRMR